jgi:hypothetical protein
MQGNAVDLWGLDKNGRVNSIRRSATDQPGDEDRRGEIGRADQLGRRLAGFRTRRTSSSRTAVRL